MIHDPSLCKLGRGPVIRPVGMKMLTALTAVGLPPAPKNPAWYLGGKSYDNRTLAPVSAWDMDGNDKFGCCVFAGSSHAEQTWSNAAGKLFVPTEAQVLGAYSDYTGFNAADPNTDNGAVEGDTWTRWETSGMFGDKLLGFVGLNPKSVAQIGDAIAYFGGSMLGVELPIAAQDQDLWDVPAGGPVGSGAPGSWGGHCVWLINRDDAGVTLVTWGALKRATWAWMATYCSEAYALLSPKWIDSKGKTPGGVPLASMMLDLKRVAVS